MPGGSRGRPVWVGAYAASVLLASGYAWSLPGGFAPILLTVLLPGVLALSRLRDAPFFGPGILSAMPLFIAFWRLAGERPDGTAPLYLLALLGAIAYLVASRRNPKTALLLLALFAFVLLVAYFSSARGGSGTMLRWLTAHAVAPDLARGITLAFRKTVHFTFYGTLGWIALQTFRASGETGGGVVRKALLVALTVASFDELRQSGYANRTGSAWDVALDLAGAATFVGLSEGLLRRKG